MIFGEDRSELRQMYAEVEFIVGERAAEPGSTRSLDHPMAEYASLSPEDKARWHEEAAECGLDLAAYLERRG